MEERTRGLGRASSAPSELVRLHIVAVNSQTSYLSQISQIISVEKNLPCGEISIFCKEFEQFMAFFVWPYQRP